jgi:hypothetical protein
VIDVVTARSGNLYRELLDLLQTQLSTSGQSPGDLYAAALRTAPAPSGLQVEAWAHQLAVGGTLPTLPLWLTGDLCTPLDLEATYQAACTARRLS